MCRFQSLVAAAHSVGSTVSTVKGPKAQRVKNVDWVVFTLRQQVGQGARSKDDSDLRPAGCNMLYDERTAADRQRVLHGTQVWVQLHIRNTAGQ